MSKRLPQVAENLDYPQNFDRCVNSVRGLYLKNMFDDASIISASKLLCLTLWCITVYTIHCIFKTEAVSLKNVSRCIDLLTEVKKLAIKVRQIFELRTNYTGTVIRYKLCRIARTVYRLSIKKIRFASLYDKVVGFSIIPKKYDF